MSSREQAFSDSLEYFNDDSLAADVWLNKYAINDGDDYLESVPTEMHKRLSREFARVEGLFADEKEEGMSEYGIKRKSLTEEAIFNYFDHFKYIVPQGSVMSVLGNDKMIGSLSNCVVIPEVVDSYAGIMLADQQLAQLCKRRCVSEKDLVITEKGMVRMKDVEVGMRVLSFDVENRKDCFCLVKNKWETDVEKEDRRVVIFGNGAELRTSKKHPVLVWNGENYYYKDVKDLIVGDICLRPATRKFNEDFNDVKRDALSVAFERKRHSLTYPIHEIEKSMILDVYKKYIKSFKIDWTKEDFNLLSSNISNLKQHGMLGSNALDLLVKHGIVSETDASLMRRRVVVSEIKEDEVSSKYYDIEVDKTNNFYAGKKGFVVVHNCGVGISIDHLRPKGAKVSNAARTSAGAVSFLHRFSNTTREVGQNGRRGALIVTLSVEHPDILDFINAKKDLTKVTGANISVKVTDEFMQAVQDDSDFTLRFPVDSSNPEITKKVKARVIWNEIVNAAHRSAEPGIMFWDRHHKYSTSSVYPGFKNISTNPCSEISMNSDSCRLIAVNLFNFVLEPFSDKAKLDKEKIYEVFYEAQRLADDLVTLELEHVERIIEKIERDPEPEDLKKIELDIWKLLYKNGKIGRRTGTGITALADMLAALGLKYDTDEAIAVAKEVMKIKTLAEFDSSIDMAIQRGKFEIFDPEIEKTSEFSQMLEVEFPEMYERMMKYGRRNISISTIAPTGSLSIMTQTSSGCEPVYELAYRRRRKVMSKDQKIDFVDDNGDGWQEYDVYHPKFKMWMSITGKSDIKESPYYNSTAKDIDWEKRIEMQSILQRYVSHSISSCLTKDSHLVHTNQGLKYIEDVVGHKNEKSFENISGVETLNYEGKIVSVSEGYFNGKAPVYEVALERGLTITGTGNHKLRVLTDSYDMCWKEIKDLKEGDIVVSRKGLQCFGNSQRTIADIMGKPFRTMIAGRNTKTVKLPIRMTKDLARFLGYVISDGGVNKNGVVLSQLRNNVVDDFSYLAKKLFDCDVSVSKDKRSDKELLSVSINSRIVRDYLEYLGITRDSHTKTVPKVIFEGAGRSQTAEFIKGLTLDGYVTSEKIAVMTTTSYKLAREIVVLLNQFGICSNLMFSPANERVLPNSEKLCQTRELWVVYCGIISARMFMSYIGFAEERKNKEAKSKLKRYKMKYPEGMVPDFGLRKAISSRMGLFSSKKIELELRSLGQHGRYGMKLSKDNILFLRDLGYNIPDFLLDDTYDFVAVKGITYKGEQETWDLHVADGNSYLVNGIVSHNTLNLPNDVTIERVSEIYHQAWKRGLKGVTVYRDGCRTGVLVSKESNGKGKIKIEDTKAPERPEIVPCDIHYSRVGGEQWIFFIGLLVGRPYEIFGGKCDKLKIPGKYKSGWIIKGKRDPKGVRIYDLVLGSLEENDSNYMKVPGIQFLFEAESGSYTRIISLQLRHGVPLPFICDQLHKTSPSSMFTFERAICRVLKKYVADGSKAGTSCPKCGMKALQYKEGCVMCKNCGYSGCN